MSAQAKGWEEGSKLGGRGTALPHVLHFKTCGLAAEYLHMAGASRIILDAASMCRCICICVQACGGGALASTGPALPLPYHQH